RAARTARPLVRRLHRDEHRLPPCPGSGVVVAQVLRGRRPVPPRLPGAVLRRLRTVLRTVRSGRWGVSGTPDPAGARRGEELVLPAVPLPGPPVEAAGIRRGTHSPARAAQRGAGVRTRGTMR